MTAEVLDMIQELREEGRDFILVTHEMGFARQVADQVAFLAEGRIVESGPVAQLLDAPAAPHTRAFLAKVLKYRGGGGLVCQAVHPSFLGGVF